MACGGRYPGSPLTQGGRVVEWRGTRSETASDGEDRLWQAMVPRGTAAADDLRRNPPPLKGSPLASRFPLPLNNLFSISSDL
ncbi:hypothetical protein DPEC_G00031390 [Dallia pectoralis]|uniref:Uncharacterized protein n=1 Tax=Dallia pectoralis TaxID=75939 RepID=A0ACC2HCC3_DALPE|nr:hypothetical protein DPEC_G00031390 [Dallia pectoralis]